MAIKRVEQKSQKLSGQTAKYRGQCSKAKAI